MGGKGETMNLKETTGLNKSSQPIKCIGVMTKLPCNLFVNFINEKKKTPTHVINKYRSSN